MFVEKRRFSQRAQSEVEPVMCDGAEQNCCGDDNADNPIGRRQGCRESEVKRSNLDLRRDPRRNVVVRKKNHQGPSDFPSLGERTGAAGCFRDKSRQLLARFVPAEYR